MNRLIIIGNGFDLAHGLKTDYNSFIVWYVKKCFSEAYEKNIYEDELLKISKRPHELFNIRGITTVSEFVDFFYKNTFSEIFDNIAIKIPKWSPAYTNPFHVEVKSSFFTLLVQNCNNVNWVDIENEFYEVLKALLKSKKEDKISFLNNLNLSLKTLIKELEDYLNSLATPEISQEYKSIFESRLKSNEILYNSSVLTYHPEASLILNFNYTTTVENYFGAKGITKKIDVNYIHGKIHNQTNPLVFGFGDELDSDYNKLELEKINLFFSYIKSFWYFKISNYHNLIRFIDSKDFQVFILGHSCGLSDRTMLNMIFEHANCKSIKIYYHEAANGNNYENLTQEISRHFKDKASMRRKIVSFDNSEPMPQVYGYAVDNTY